MVLQKRGVMDRSNVMQYVSTKFGLGKVPSVTVVPIDRLVGFSHYTARGVVYVNEVAGTPTSSRAPQTQPRSSH